VAHLVAASDIDASMTRRLTRRLAEEATWSPYLSDGFERIVVNSRQQAAQTTLIRLLDRSHCCAKAKNLHSRRLLEASNWQYKA
jgi:hypothetical protein